ncbi:hypothetical protein GCK72_021408 [Caenorhabditis remanei]|uniref:F-box domain-containing protein n=1 Tax=Caenorhabditis remanei TaxID=31234 RepID=A0A6A5GJH1_CAERE|nr:hypothetical protein GCK72_021408 [Caenorhabditis remanei]KAF1754843.1 hypothetical protein GCK72_021408 [Caenorhabditis remanei]
MADDPPLLQLPEITMNHILYFCDYSEIAQLRKVCHSLRNHIDLFKPDAHVEEVLLGNGNNAVICFDSEQDSRIYIDYKEAEGGCTVNCDTFMGRYSLKTISGMNPMDVLIQDFKIYMRHLKTPLRQFQLYEVCFDVLFQIKRKQPPESQIFPLKVNELELYGLSADQILATLPLFDANHLKDLRIEGTEGDRLNEDDFHAFFETEHWRKAEKICLLSNLNIPNVRQISHLKEFHGSISRMTAADAVFLKNTFISSPVFERCCIKVDVDLNSLPLQDIFGPSFFDRITNSNRWYFHIPNDTNSALRVDVSSSNEFEIARMNRRYVVPGAVIIY